MQTATVVESNVVDFDRSRTAAQGHATKLRVPADAQPAPTHGAVESRLETSRKELLDLGLRNALINHRPRAKQVKVVDELSTEVYRLLVEGGRAMTFEALPEELAEALSSDNRQGAVPSDTPTLEQLLRQPEEEENGGVAGRHRDTKLQTSMVADKLQSRLLSIHNDARTYLEEQGVNILYLALGFLHWYETPSASEPRRAPLLLIPVELTRTSAQERFRIAYTGGDITDNLSLLEKLKAEFSLSLPEIGDAEALDPSAFFTSVEGAIAEARRWKVERNEITLGFFSFGKFLMYRDLDAGVWPGAGPQNHHILSALLSEGFSEPPSAYGDETHIDEVISPAEIHQVKDADSSQILAILDVNAGRNLVLQGPPGTGKSQTITNIISEAVGAGRRVLFVSEKMAALDVVKRRLDEVGLGDAVLELHSHKTNKRQVLEELNRTLHAGKPITEDAQDDIDSLTLLRDKLNAYAEAVNAPIGNTRISFIRALGQVQALGQAGAPNAGIDFHPMATWSESDYRAARMAVEGLDRHLAEAGAPDHNPFKGSQLADFAPSQRPALEEALQQAQAATERLRSLASTLATHMGLEAPASLQEIVLTCRAAQRAQDGPDLDGVQIASPDWLERDDDVSRLVLAGDKLAQLRATYNEWLIEEAWNHDLLAVRQQYAAVGGKWWRFLSGNFRRAKAALGGLCRQAVPKNQGEALQLIDAVLESQRHQSTLDELAGFGATLFGAKWKREASDWNRFAKLQDWLVAIHRDLRDGQLPAGMLEFLASSPDVALLSTDLQAVTSMLERQEAAIAAMVSALQFEQPDANPFHSGITLEAQAGLLDHWIANLDQLYKLVQFHQLAAELEKHGLSAVVAAARRWEAGAGSLVATFDAAWYNGLVETAYRDNPAIKLFDRVQHEYVIDEFKRLDRLLFQHNRARLALKHWNALPHISGGGELSVIHREINKKRRHLPIRRLMEQAGRAVQSAKPVFMMSPMSVATFLPPGSVSFDLVVFDEASQVKPVDAFGAILRGNQAVVVGDSKQLPPTSFFDSLVEAEDEEECDSVGDMESILSLFLGKGAPERMLRWHYRSRHQSLIAVSNNEFYDNRLVVFPSPGVNPKARGLRLRHLPDTAYDRGRTRTNPLEAKAVAQVVMEHARTHPDLTLGVVAFSVAQRDAIEQQLELLRREDPSLEPFFSEDMREPFFIKNLENVQGDERDVIFISVGYGKTAEGYLSMSFGPLNREGGERRLNVLISRSRLAMDVFSNFRAGDIDLARTNARGVAALRSFLSYAETGTLEQAHSTGKEPDSEFEEAVIAALRKRGVEVEAQVGTAGFFIDIAVKDPEYPGAYLLGIECDGATYHSSRSARDRDRLRQDVLEGLGWTLHRIWSTEWYRNPEGELERVLDALEKARVQRRLVAVPCEAEKPAQPALSDTIEREDKSRQDEGLTALAAPYRRAEISISTGMQELHELPLDRLLSAVKDVVEIESPVHVQELTRRITEAAGLKRAGSRIRSVVEKALQLGKRQGEIQIRDDFVWSNDMTIPPVRDRSQFENSLKKIDWVAPEEIAEALCCEVERSFTTTHQEAISGAARLLGFQRVTNAMHEVFAGELDALIQSRRLRNDNGSVMSAAIGTAQA